MTPLEQVLEQYGVRFREGATGWQSVHCPVSGLHRRQDRNKSMSVSVEEQAVNCHACGTAGGVPQLIMALEGVDLREGIRRAEALLDGSGGVLQPVCVGGEFLSRRARPERAPNDRFLPIRVRRDPTPGR